jgi:hypothetical protein
MCGSCTPPSRLQASGILNEAGKGHWIAFAEELAELSDQDFEKVVCAFRLIRRASVQERLQEPGKRRRKRT